MQVTSELIGHNIRRVRSQKGLKQESVAAKAGLSRAAYQKIERGCNLPRVSSVQKIASALGVNFADLIQDANVLKHVRFRANRSMKKRENILIRVSVWLKNFNELESMLEDYRENKIDALIRRAYEIEASEKRIKIIATEARKMLGLSEEEPIWDICSLLESSGVKIMRLLHTTGNFFGLSVIAEDGGPAIVVNVRADIPVERWIFSAAHELGHLILHTGSYSVEESNEVKEEELQANEFAAHFLMPDKSLDLHLKQWRGLRLVDAVLKIKRFFGVSYKTVLKRLIETGRADENVWQSFATQYEMIYKKRLSFKEEPLGIDSNAFQSLENDFGFEPERLSPGDFIEDRFAGLIRRGIEEGHITMSWAAQAAGIELHVMKEWAASWKYLDDAATN